MVDSGCTALINNHDFLFIYLDLQEHISKCFFKDRTNEHNDYPDSQQLFEDHTKNCPK